MREGHSCEKWKGKMIQNAEAEKVLETGRIGMETKVAEVWRLEGRMVRDDVSVVGGGQIEHGECTKGSDLLSSHQVAL